MKAPSTISYNVVSCTSEDPSNPISTIQTSSIRSSGWQSSNNPRYPVEFVIDFGLEAEIDTIQFVSHQYKIASRVDLYVSKSDKKFQALGSFQFSDNSFTNFTARELKSATLNGIRAQFVKVSIPGCHVNASNPGNQVGLISLNVIGRGGSLMKTQHIPVKQGDGSSAKDMLEQLERQKKEAVAKEDFKQAEMLKQQIERLKKAYDQIAVLQKQKNEAVAREDYATAQTLKNEIDFLLKGDQQFSKTQNFNMSKQIEQSFSRTKPLPKQAIQQDFDDNFHNEPEPEPEPIKPPPRRKQPPREKPPSPPPANPQKQQKPPPKQNIQQSNNIFDDGVSSLENAIPPPPRRDLPMGDPDDRPIHPAKDAFNEPKNFADERPIHPAKDAFSAPKNLADERPIHPARDIGGKAGAPPKRAPPRQGGNDDMVKDPEELKPEQASEAGLLIDLFGKRPVACFYSHAWNLRVSGITDLGKLICGLKDNQVNAFSRYCYIMRHRVLETHRTVFQTAIDNVKSTAEKLNLSASDLERCINQFIPQLIPKVGCAQAALSKIACKFLLWLCDKGLYDIVVPIVTKPLKNKNQYLIALAQIHTMRKMIIRKGDIKSIRGLSLQSIMAFVVPCLESAKNEVRTEAIEMIVALEAICGSTIYQYFEKVNPKTRAAIDSAIKQAKEK